MRDADHVLAIEVKGTLRPGCVPRLSRRAVAQMSAAWIDKADNPGMAAWELQSDDVSAAVIAVNFADMTLRAVVSDDFRRWLQVALLEDLGGSCSSFAAAYGPWSPTQPRGAGVQPLGTPP
jgi:hypothetical protein